MTAQDQNKHDAIAELQAEIENNIPLGYVIEGKEHYQNQGLYILRQFTIDLDSFTIDASQKLAYLELTKLLYKMNHDSHEKCYGCAICRNASYK